MKEAERLKTAEEVCWCLLLMMELGGLEISKEWKRFIAEPMEKWCDLAVEIGILKKDSAGLVIAK